MYEVEDASLENLKLLTVLEGTGNPLITYPLAINAREITDSNVLQLLVKSRVQPDKLGAIP
jgi:hypothetical protein